MSAQVSHASLGRALSLAGWEFSSYLPKFVPTTHEWVFRASYRAREIEVVLPVDSNSTVCLRVHDTHPVKRWGWWQDTTPGAEAIERHWHVAIEEELVSVVVALSAKALGLSDDMFLQILTECILSAYEVATDLIIDGVVRGHCERLEPALGFRLAKNARFLKMKSGPAKRLPKSSEANLASWKDRWFRFNLVIFGMGLIFALINHKTHTGPPVIESWTARVGLMFMFYFSWVVIEVAFVRTKATKISGRRFEKLALAVSLVVLPLACRDLSSLLIGAQFVGVPWLWVKEVDEDAKSKRRRKPSPTPKYGEASPEFGSWAASLMRQGWSLRGEYDRGGLRARGWTDSVTHSSTSMLKIVGRHVVLEHVEGKLRIAMSVCETSWLRSPGQGVNNLPRRWIDVVVSPTDNVSIYPPRSTTQSWQACEQWIGVAIPFEGLAPAVDTGVMDWLAHLVRERVGASAPVDPYRG